MGCVAMGLIAAVGCGESTANTGVVRFDDGEPVQSGSVEFRHRETKEAFAGRIGPDGSFALWGGDGGAAFPAGDYEVVVVQIVTTEDLAAEDHRHGRTVPRRYADYYTSGLTYQNTPDREDPVEIVLSTDSPSSPFARPK